MEVYLFKFGFHNNTLQQKCVVQHIVFDIVADDYAVIVGVGRLHQPIEQIVFIFRLPCHSCRTRSSCISARRMSNKAQACTTAMTATYQTLSLSKEASIQPWRGFTNCTISKAPEVTIC